MRKNSCQSSVQKSIGRELYNSWGSAVYNAWQSLRNERTNTQLAIHKHAPGAQKSLVMHRQTVRTPLFFHPVFCVNTSGIQALIPTIHTTYNKHDNVYIK